LKLSARDWTLGPIFTKLSPQLLDPHSSDPYIRSDCDCRSKHVVPRSCLFLGNAFLSLKFEWDPFLNLL
jgi:hypothetical protein